MVKFSQRLEANKVWEWKQQYIDYSGLKKWIDAKGPPHAALAIGIDAPLLSPAEESFLGCVKQEADKVESCFQGCLASCRRKWEELRLPLRQEDTKREHVHYAGSDAEEDEKHKPSFQVRDLYRKITRLRNFCIINFTGFVKITKKHAKKKGSSDAEEAMRYVRNKRFAAIVEGRQDGLQALLSQIELEWGHKFHMQPDEAHYRLLTRRWNPTDWRTFKRGLNIGITLQLLLWVTWAIFMESNILRSPTWQTVHTSTKWMTVQLPVYRGIGCFTWAVWCWGFCLYFWEIGRVNYLYVFEWDETRSRRHSEVLDWATTWTQWFLLNFLLFFKSLHGVNPMPVSAAVFPLLLYASFFGILLTMSREQWEFTWQTATRIITSPFGEVAFWDAFAADALTSLVQPMSDLVYSTCYFGSGEWLRSREEQGICESSPMTKEILFPLIAALPLWFRLCQNLHKYHDKEQRFPWLLNALKYATSLTVVVFGAFHPQMQRRGSLTSYKIAYFCAFIGSTLFSFAWDVTQDWRLLRIDRDEQQSWCLGLVTSPKMTLRRQKMYGSETPYCAAVAADLFLRFMWTTTLIPSEHMLEQMPTFFSVISPFTAAAEVCRRAMWAVFRVESEHLQTEGFRKVGMIPLHFDDAFGAKNEEQQTRERTQQERSKVLVITEIFVFSVVVAALATTAILTRSAPG